MGDHSPLSSFHRDIGIPINFQEESSLVSFWSLVLHEPLEVSRDVSPPVQIRWGTWIFSRVSTGDSDNPSFCEMNREAEFKPLQGNPAIFWVRPLVVHSTWDRKHRVPFSYLLLRENSTLGACGKLAHLFSQRQWISSHLEMICGEWNFLPTGVLKWLFI